MLIWSRKGRAAAGALAVTLALRQHGATLQKYLGLAFYLPSAIPSVSVGLGILVAFS